MKMYDLILYIPHGSDESSKTSSYYLTKKTLYPTWFR